MARHLGTSKKIRFFDRPDRETIIDNDDIIGLKIDLNLLSTEEFIKKYCSSTGKHRMKSVYRKRRASCKY